MRLQFVYENGSKNAVLGFKQNRFSGTKSWNMRLDDVALFVIFLESNIVVMLVFAMLSPGGQIAVYFFS